MVRRKGVEEERKRGGKEERRRARGEETGEEGRMREKE